MDLVELQALADIRRNLVNQLVLGAAEKERAQESRRSVCIPTFRERAPSLYAWRHLCTSLGSLMS